MKMSSTASKKSVAVMDNTSLTAYLLDMLENQKQEQHT